MALGAQSAGILVRFLRESLALAAGGIVLGLTGAAALSRTLESFIWGVKPLDPATYRSVAAVIASVAVAATLLPALCAAGTNPVEALRLD
jgi:putative ABC transport system permease protein